MQKKDEANGLINAMQSCYRQIVNEDYKLDKKLSQSLATHRLLREIQVNGDRIVHGTDHELRAFLGLKTTYSRLLNEWREYA